ncbi:PepSY-associated TM helix domain-containing protein [Tahibacter soli]|uniref:PepSY-associated TM helix domain-containing protein n=1 Tax=Tahibacter soli TaxID=2983605 RepID=A0A9X4BIY9_9GAMM|nr:PepSY-associated TM helix domain-containing protein [Tahibacter soli]MDC8015765.1 PepSY-associated TM helix domain-containing protein [Tahibacter soli]
MHLDPQRRAWWLKTLVQWHWISSAVCLVGLALFAVTGITLNHASQIGAEPVVTNRQAQLPDALKARLAAEAEGKTGKSPVPDELARWLATDLGVAAAGKTAEWNDGEIYLSLPRPGGDAWASVDFADGKVEYEKTDRGWVSWLNDLHKGRNTGPVWTWFIDVFAVACFVFAVTGLLLLQFHAQRRPSTWPLVGLGLLVPVLLALLFIH